MSMFRAPFIKVSFINFTVLATLLFSAAFMSGCSQDSKGPAYQSDVDEIRAKYSLFYSAPDENGLMLQAAAPLASPAPAPTPIPSFSGASNTHLKFRTVKFNICSDYTLTGTALPSDAQTLCAQESLPPQCDSVGELLQRSDYLATLERLTGGVNDFAEDLTRRGYQYDAATKKYVQTITFPDGKTVITTYSPKKIQSAVLQDACDPLMVRALNLTATIEPTILRLTWQKEGVFDGFKGFRVLRSYNAIPSSCSSADASVVTIDESAIKSNTAYALAGLKDNADVGVLVCPVGISQVSNSGETRLFGEVASGMFRTAALPPQEPSNLLASVVQGQANPKLSWQKGVYATGYVLAYNNNGSVPAAGCGVDSALKVIRLSNIQTYTLALPWENNIERSYVARICSSRAGYAYTDGATVDFRLGYPTLSIASVPVSVRPGDTITVTGTGFVALTEMTFGGVALIEPVVVSANQMTFKAPTVGVQGSFRLRLVRGTAAVESGLVEVNSFWRRQLGGSSYEYANSVAVDSSGNVYIAGYAGGSFEGERIKGGVDAFLAKLDKNGNLLWSTQLGGSSWDIAVSVAIDSSGNAFITGYTGGSFEGGQNLGGADAFLAKLDTNGNLLWSKQLGGSAEEIPYSVAMDSSGNAFITGYTGGSFEGAQNLGSSDVFLAKLDTNGNTVWSKQFGGSSYEYANSVAVDSSGNIYIAGYTGGSFAGGQNLGGADAFLAKLDTNGNLLWSKQLGGSSHAVACSVAVDSSGNIYIAGYTGGSFAGGQNLGSDDAFLAKLDTNGNTVWSKQLGGSSYEYARSVAVDSSGNIYIAGKTDGSFEGGQNLGGADAFLAKLDTNGNILWSKQLGGSDADWGTSVAVDSSGNAYITGGTEGSFEGGQNLGSSDAFLAKLGQ